MKFLLNLFLADLNLFGDSLNAGDVSKWEPASAIMMCISIFYLSNLSKQLEEYFLLNSFFLTQRYFLYKSSFLVGQIFMGGCLFLPSLKFFGYSLFVWKNNKHKYKGYQEEWKQLIMWIYCGPFEKGKKGTLITMKERFPPYLFKYLLAFCIICLYHLFQVSQSNYNVQYSNNNCSRGFFHFQFFLCKI